MKKLKDLDLDLVISFSILCSLLSAVTLGILTVVLTFHSFVFGYTVMYTIIYFLFYLLFASTIQIMLSLKPKKFYIPYLLVYVVGALVASAIVFFLMDDVGNPFIMTSYYVISGSAAIIFWLFDSIILQGEIDN
ncbi:UPF0715 family protein [Ornithinibacillus massiliensis]|uniref:UPF0715 family protein n=1 Tax=Ornithinibacillus massiliensis TaxID=1944633 RepID=A0ABS5MHF2_9BACI|nr:UPF0715 family protein [Ornithinibacillus massiliensis]MBS3681775.1 UPF0715 family protein [Ornithinibacillus massiliensis]